MANVERVVDPEYRLMLSQSEIDGLYTLLNYGITVETVDRLKLTELYRLLKSRDYVGSVANRFKSLAEL